jgi:hypothetical protein
MWLRMAGVRLGHARPRANDGERRDPGRDKAKTAARGAMIVQ